MHKTIPLPQTRYKKAWENGARTRSRAQPNKCNDRDGRKKTETKSERDRNEKKIVEESD